MGEDSSCYPGSGRTSVGPQSMPVVVTRGLPVPQVTAGTVHTCGDAIDPIAGVTISRSS
jgi:hypothetical protein